MSTTPITTMVPSPLTPESARPFFSACIRMRPEHRAEDGARAAEDRGAAEDHAR